MSTIVDHPSVLCGFTIRPDEARFEEQDLIQSHPEDVAASSFA
jgi:hypothetical protein